MRKKRRILLKKNEEDEEAEEVRVSLSAGCILGEEVEEWRREEDVRASVVLLQADLWKTSSM